MSKRHIAAMFGVDPRTVSRWVASGQFPKPDLVFNARSKRWQAGTVLAHLATLAEAQSKGTA